MFERVLITTLHVLVYYPELSMLRSGAIKCNLIQSNYFNFIHICNNTCHVNQSRI